MKRNGIVLNIGLIVLAGIIVVLDQLTKKYIMGILVFGETMPILPFLNFTLLANDGVAFSFFSNYAGKLTNFFIIINSLVSCYIIYWLFFLSETKINLTKVSLMCILGGAIGNLIDRAIFGYVIDFIHIFYNKLYFPVFNVADSAISIGVVLLLVDMFKLNRK